jgi:PAS domain S-box-containing protein
VSPSENSQRGPRAARLVGLAAIGCAVVGALLGLHRMAAREIAAQRSEELASLAASHVEQLRAYRSERAAEAVFLARLPSVDASIQRLSVGADVEAAADLEATISALMANHDYPAAWLLDASGRVVAQLGDVREPMDVPVSTLEQARREAAPVLRDRVTGADRALALDLVIAARSRRDPARVSGFIVLRASLRSFLVEILASAPAAAGKGTTLLVGRFPEGEIVVSTGASVGDARALRVDRRSADPPSPSGAFEGLDPLGAASVGYAESLPGTDWSIVARVDRAVADADTRARELRQAGAGGAGLAVLGALAAAFYRARVAAARLREERRRRELAERYESLFRHGNDALLLLDDELRVLDANDRALAIYGHTLDELRTMTVRDLRAPATRAGIDDDLRGIFEQGGAVFETLHQRRDGSAFEVEVSARAVTVDGRRSIESCVRDISARLAAERTLRSLNRAYGLLGGVGEATARLRSRDALFAETCRIAVESGGYPLAWIGLVEGDSPAVRVAVANGPARAYLDHVTVTCDEAPTGQGPTGTAIREGRTDVCADFADDRMTTWKSTALRHGLRCSAALPLRVEGRVIGALTLYAADVSFFGREEVAALERVAALLSFALEGLAREAHHAEVERSRAATEAALIRSQKLESLGLLAGGVAHDFNNLLTAILGYAQFLADALPEGSDERSDAEEIKQTGERAAALTRQLLAFSRKQAITPTGLDLGALVGGLSKMLRRVLGEQIELVVAAPERAVWLCADPGQLEQVVVNLAVNARDAMPRGGSLRLAIDELTVEADAGPMGPTAGRWARLRVSDNGHGMTEHVLGRLFEPFFTTKEKGRGTGLGLATCFGIVRQSGGTIRAQSVLGAGTTMEVLLPAIDPQSASAAASRASPPALGHALGVLLVEDDAAVRAMASRALVEAGYRVVEARDGEEASRKLLDGAADFAIVVSDVVMPVLGGIELVARVKAAHPAVRTLLISGYLDRPAGALDADGFLAKPFTPTALVLRVQELLARPRPAAP